MIMDLLYLFLVTIVIFIILWVIGLLIRRSFITKKVASFLTYINQNYPKLNRKKEDLLIAKQKSQQIQPDIILLLDESMNLIIIVREVRDKVFTHVQYNYDELKSAKSSHRILNRGFIAQSYSYEQTLEIEFINGDNYFFKLENLSNKLGDDHGADVVKILFDTFQQKLNKILGGSPLSE